MFDTINIENAPTAPASGHISGVSRRSGLLHSTRVATDRGWREAEALCVGDRVLTFDNGYQRLVSVERVVNWPDHETCPDHVAPFAVPEGALGNKDHLWVLPNQRVLVKSDLAKAKTGDPFALVPIKMLAGWRGITRVAPRAPHLVIVLHFAQDEVIYAGEGALLLMQAQGSQLNLEAQSMPYGAYQIDHAQAVADCLRAGHGRFAA